MNKCVFFDRDGVLNEDSPHYVYEPENLNVFPEIPPLISNLKANGYLIIVVTNQAGISRGIYSREQMRLCHKKLMVECNHQIDHIYYSPFHPDQTESLSRKPKSLLFEKAIARFRIDPDRSWMVGDRDRDLIPAKKLGIKTIGIKRNEKFLFADFESELKDLLHLIESAAS